MSNFTDFFPSGGGGVSLAGSVAAEILLVGGGGGSGESTNGATNSQGGGGAGGYYSDFITLLSTRDYRVSVGSGGSGGYNWYYPGADGQPTSIIGPGISGVMEAGGGGGGGKQTPPTGSGGGVGTGASTSPLNTQGVHYTNYGYSGGYQSGGIGGGGGGASEVGQSGNGSPAGKGGDGLSTTIISDANATAAFVGQVISGDVFFAGGGGAASNSGNGKGTNCGGGGQPLTFNTRPGDTGVCIIRIPTSSFTGTTFKDDSGSIITPGPGVAVETFSQGTDDTVVVFRSGITIMTLI